jgi:hypothetical protein
MMDGLTAETRDAIAALLAARSDHGADPAVAADLVHRVVYGAAEQDLWLDPAAMPGDRLAAELARAVLAYLEAT